MSISESVAVSRRPCSSNLSSFLFSFELQQLLNDLVGIDFELVIEVVLHFGLQLVVGTVYAEIALNKC